MESASVWLCGEDRLGELDGVVVSEVVEKIWPHKLRTFLMDSFRIENRLVFAGGVVGGVRLQSDGNGLAISTSKARFFLVVRVVARWRCSSAVLADGGEAWAGERLLKLQQKRRTEVREKIISAACRSYI